MLIDLVPFTVPNYVSLQMPPRPRQEGCVESPKFTLTEIDAGSLGAICDQFRAEVFRKAGKRDPQTEGKTPC